MAEDNGRLAVIVPFKGGADAKSRLATAITPAQRRLLAMAMYRDLMNALANTAPAAGVFVATASAEAAQIAQRHGFNVIRDAEGADLNQSLGVAAGRAYSLGFTRAIFLHADLPLVDHQALTWLMSSAARHRGFIIRDAGGEGTNALCTKIPLGFPLGFGPGSAELHLRRMAGAGFDCTVLNRAEFSCDIDTPRDLNRLRSLSETGQQPGPVTFAFLRSDRSERDHPENVAKGNGWMETAMTEALSARASAIRVQQWGRTMTYSRKVFIPLTRLCRDVCHYCTFATRPRNLTGPYLSIDEVLSIARAGQEAGCKEALFTLGDKPELRYSDARAALAAKGYATTIDYLVEAAKAVSTQTALIPHINAGLLTPDDIARLRPWSGSAGLMLESGSDRLAARGMPHQGSPDKIPAERLKTLAALGEAKMPTTTGLLIGIGETRAERLADLETIAELHARFGHIQEVIIQNFRAKPGTRMAVAPDATLEELVWTIAAARVILPEGISLQAPPNLNAGATHALISAGINDWGGISPVTPDHVNPEAPWPEIAALDAEVNAAGFDLEERLTIYPSFVRRKEIWADQQQHRAIDRWSDAHGFARSDDWMTGRSRNAPSWVARSLSRGNASETPISLSPIRAGLLRIMASKSAPEESDVVRLFTSRGDDFTAVLEAADRLRQKTNGDTVTYVVNRNINYTNICYFKCRFCGFSKGKTHEHLRGKPYNIGLEEIQHRVVEARQRGATEVCLQGGIHPEYTGQTYLDICAAVREAAPDIHIHAFSPLEIAQGARTLGLSLENFLTKLRQAGLNTLPGTAAEILDDEVRVDLCHDKLNTEEWFEVMRVAHRVGLKSTSTIMFGHIDRYEHWARHLLRLRHVAAQSGGFTEFVPLPFVAHEAPIFLQGKSRAGPTFREALLMHAVARLVLSPLISNIQASWVKLGEAGVAWALSAGVNDLGGTLMDETITRSSGGAHGSEMTVSRLTGIIASSGRTAAQRTTTYGPVNGAARPAARSD